MTSPIDNDSIWDTNSSRADKVAYKISDSNSVDITFTSIVSSVAGSLNSTTTSLCTSNTLGTKRARNSPQGHAYALYKRKYQSKPTYNQYASNNIDDG